MNKAFRTLLVASALSLAAPSAKAGPAETNALQLFDEGRKAFEKKSYDAALGSFEASLQLVASPNTRLYIGRCLRAMGKMSSARTALLRAAAEAHDAAAAGEIRYRGTEEAAKAEAEALAQKIPHLVVVVPPSVKAPLVTLDGVEVPPQSYEKLDVDPGPHVVKATAARAQPFESTVDAQPGATVRVEVVLTSRPLALVRVELADRPAGYSIAVDGKPLETSALAAPLELVPGPHTIVVSAPGRADFQWSEVLHDGDDVSLVAALPQTTIAGLQAAKSFPKWPFFALGGASIVALGAATALAANAKSISDTEQAKPIGERTGDERDHVTSLSHEANALFIVGGALLVGTAVVGYFTWRTERSGKPRATARMAPWVGCGAGGVVTGGTF